MEVIPAIDLRGGRCVRLLQGDYARETQFSDDPVAVARRWEQAGAPRIHVVDLDGAREGGPRNLEIVADIARAVAVPLQLGGGIRSLALAEKALAAGVQRVVIGTVAALEVSLAEEMIRAFGDRLIITLDTRSGLVAVRGWQEATHLKAVELARRLEAVGARRFIFTDIRRDGMLSGPNVDALRRLRRAVSVPVIASGGIASLHHLRKIADAGAEGAIVGRALYVGELNLEEAVRAC
jgi:phosphoribosylformimino-5-aminoimidazole carboxamide ribotide isomerase